MYFISGDIVQPCAKDIDRKETLYSSWSLLVCGVTASSKSAVHVMTMCSDVLLSQLLAAAGLN